MFTYKFFTRNGTLQLRLTSNRVKKDMSLSYPAIDGELEYAMSTAKGRRSELGRKLAMYEMILSNISQRLFRAGLDSADVAVIKREFEEAIGLKPTTDVGNGMFLQWFERFMDSKTNNGTRGIYKHTLERMRLFDSKLALRTFSDIDFKWLTSFESFCARTASKNARNIHLRNIRAVFNNAIDNELTTEYPFRRFKIRPEPTCKRSLTVDELRTFIDMDVEKYQRFYKDMFLLSFYLIGINTVDLARLKEITSDERIEYERAKTHRKYSVRVEPEAREIIERYRGKNGLLCISDRWSDHKNFLHQFNRALKNMGGFKRIGRGGKKERNPLFPKLSSYWCRHTWATIAYNECGISEDIIAQALGHASAHATTSIYINRNAKLVDEANRKVIDWVLYGRQN